MRWLSLFLFLLVTALVLAADEPVDTGEQALEEEVLGEETLEEETLEEPAPAAESEPAEPPRSRIKRPRRLGDIFKPSEEITADSAISFPADI